MLGGMAGTLTSIGFNLLMMLLFAPKAKDTISYGPRLDSLKPAVKDIQGQVINLAYGTTRISGTIFWSSNIRETVHKDEQELEGAKGGGNATHTDVTYTYDLDMAVGICEGTIEGIRKIWCNKELIYNIENTPPGISWLKYRLYNGSEIQEPDTLLQSYIGVNYTSAHRGLAYIVFEQFQLDQFGRRIPQAIEFEVVAKGVVSGGTTRYNEVGREINNDTGTRYVPEINPIMIDSSYFPNMMIIPVHNWDYELRYIKFLPEDGTAVRAIISTPPIQVGDNTWGSLIYNAFSSGQSVAGAYRYMYSYTWREVSYQGTYKKVVPCMILCTSMTGAVSYGQAGYAIFNLINDKCINAGMLRGSASPGSFTDYFYKSIHSNKILILGGTQNYWSFKFHELNDRFTSAQPTSIDDVDDLGFKLHPVDISLDIHQILHTDYDRLKLNTKLVLVGFTLPYENLTFDSNANPEIEKIERFTSYECINVLSSADIGNIKHQNYSYSISDSNDYHASSMVQMNIVITTTTTYKSGIVTDDISDVTSWYPAEFSTFSTSTVYIPDIDAYDNIMHLIVHYVDTGNDVISSERPPMWIRFTDGRELICLKTTTNRYDIYEKSPFFTQSDDDYLSTVDNQDIAYGWAFRKKLPTALNQALDNRTTTKPRVQFLEGDYPLYSEFEGYDNNDVFYYVSPANYANSNSPFVKIKENLYIPPYYTYTAESYNIDYVIDGDVYEYHISDNTVLKALDTNAPVRGIQSYGGGWIGYTDSYSTSYDNNGDAQVWSLFRDLDRAYSSVGEIIRDITEKAEISLSDIYISSDADRISVYGYNISDDIKLQDVLEHLIMHKFVDALDSEWKIKFKTKKEYLKQFQNIPTIYVDEQGVKEYGDDDYAEKYNVLLKEDIELPSSLSYIYVSPENNFSQANVVVIRNIDFSIGIKHSVTCPVAITTKEAYNNAYRILFDAHRANKEVQFRLPIKYAYIEPGDVVIFPTNAHISGNENLVLKIINVTAEANKYLELVGIEEDARILEDYITDGSFESAINTIIPITVSKSIKLDISPLYNKYIIDDYMYPGIYSAVYSASNLWRGGSLHISKDGITFNRILDFYPPGPIVMDVLQASNYFVLNEYADELNSFKVYSKSSETLYNEGEDLINYSEGNLIAIKSKTSGTIELMQFKNLATNPENPREQTISGLVRGLYNTYNKDTVFAPGDEAIFIPAGVKFLPLETGLYNSTIYTKDISFGQNSDSGIIGHTIYKAKWYTPLGVCNISSVVSSGNIVFSWNSRERNKPAYIFRSPEVFDAKIFKLELYKDGTLVRTINDHSSDAYTYTAANMSADGISTNDIIKIKITRKATFLEYNHSVYDEHFYIPKNINTITYLQSISNNNVKLYINFDKQESLNITNYNNYTITYNNNNGKDRLYTSSSPLNPGCNLFTNYDKLTCTMPSLLTEETIYTWVYLYDMGSDYNVAYSIIAGKIGAYISLTIGRIKYIANIDSVDVDVPLNKWLFVGVSQNSARNRESLYIRSLDDTFKYFNTFTYACGAVGNTFDLYRNESAYPPAAEKTKVKTQNMVIIEKDLIYNGSTYNESVYENLYMLGKSKCQPV